MMLFMLSLPLPKGNATDVPQSKRPRSLSPEVRVVSAAKASGRIDRRRKKLPRGGPVLPPFLHPHAGAAARIRPRQEIHLDTGGAEGHGAGRGRYSRGLVVPPGAVCTSRRIRDRHIRGNRDMSFHLASLHRQADDRRRTGGRLAQPVGLALRRGRGAWAGIRHWSLGGVYPPQLPGRAKRGTVG